MTIKDFTESLRNEGKQVQVMPYYKAQFIDHLESADTWLEVGENSSVFGHIQLYHSATTLLAHVYDNEMKVMIMRPARNMETINPIHFARVLFSGTGKAHVVITGYQIFTS